MINDSREDSINGTFLKAIMEINEANIDSMFLFVETFSEFITKSNKNYMYNKTYLRSFYQDFENFVYNMRTKCKYFREFCNWIYSILSDNDIAHIEFDEFAYFEKINKDSDISNINIKINENPNPPAMLGRME